MKLSRILFPAILFAGFSCSSGNGTDSSAFFMKDETDFMYANVTMDFVNSVNYSQFEIALLNNEAVNKPYYDKALQLKRSSEELTKYLSELHGELVARHMNIDRKIADTLRTSLLTNLNDKSTASAFFFQDNSSGTSAVTVKAKIKEFHDKCQQLLDVPAMAHIDQLSCPDRNSTDNKVITWEEYEFRDITLAAALARLQALKLEIKNAENSILGELLREMARHQPAN